jgi:site-specific recombinase XerD
MFELLRRWLVFLEVAGIASIMTRANYRRAIIAFVADTLTDLRALTEDDVISWAAAKDPKGGQVQLTLRALRSFFGWAEDRELLHNPVKRLPTRRSKYGPAPSLSPDDLTRLLEAARSLDPRAHPTLTLLYFTGARLSSMAAVRPQDVQTDGQGRPVISFREAKGDRPYAVPIEAPEARAALDRLRELADYKAPRAKARRDTLIGVGPKSIWGWVHEASQRSGVPCHPHLLRHTFATRLAEDPEIDIRSWVELMGHADGSQLRRYAAVSEPRLRSAVGRLRIAPAPVPTPVVSGALRGSQSPL